MVFGMSWARDLFFLGVVWVIYSIYSCKDTAKNKDRPNGSANRQKVPPMEFEKLNLYEVLEVSEDATADELKVRV